MKKEIIKSIIKPFFKEKLYKNKGVKFIKNTSFFKIIAEIQAQRYYKKDKSENFRINYELICEAYDNEQVFGRLSIPTTESWFEINPRIDIIETQNKIRFELEKSELKITEQATVEQVFKNLSNHPTDLRYVFLLKKFKPELLNNWVNDLKTNIKQNETELNTFYKEREVQMKRKKSLDKEILLDGLNMNISEKKRSLEKLKYLIENYG